MMSNKIINKWISKIKDLEVNMMVPQHGLLYKKEEYLAFINWFKDLKVGEDILDEIYEK